jgi:hypothetical protein
MDNTVRDPELVFTRQIRNRSICVCRALLYPDDITVKLRVNGTWINANSPLDGNGKHITGLS